MPLFPPGADVHVAGLGKGVVRETRRGGRCLVAIKGRNVIVEERTLSPVEPRRTRRPAAPAPSGAVDVSAGRRASIDLHGMTVEQATGALDEFLNDAMLAGLADVSVIHGRSGRRLRDAVHGRLRQVTTVRGFRLDPRNPGVTLVAL